MKLFLKKLQKINTIIIMNKNYFEIKRAGINTTFQDQGRSNLYHIGIPFSGAMDNRNFQISNKLVGNETNSPVIEFAYQGPLLKYFGNDIKCAIAGDVKFIIRKNKIAVDRIFPYAKMNNFIEYISEKLDKKIELPMKNISPELSESKMNLSNETLDRLKPLIALDVNIYNQILKMGSYDSSKNDHKSSLERIINNY